MTSKNDANAILFFVLTVLLSALFLSAPGTYDMQIWEDWSKAVRAYGFVQGYALIDDVQPPLCSVFLAVVGYAAKTSGLSELYAIKLSVTILLWLSALLFLAMTRSWITAGLFQLVLTVNVGLGYLDIYYTPFLLGALFALERGEYALALFCYAIAALVKSQPLILAPFIITHIWFQRPTRNQVTWFARIVAPTFLIIVFPVLLVYNKTLLQFLSNAQHGHYISGNALNLGWIVTYIIRLLHLSGQELISWGLNNYLPPIPAVSGALKLLFFTAFGVTFYRFCKSATKTFDDLVVFMSAAFFSYFMLNSGVHENHLFIFMVLSVLLYHKGVISKLDFCLTAIFGNLNLILFYGIDGHGLRFDRGIVPVFDISVIFSILFLLFFTSYFCKANKIMVPNSLLRLKESGQKHQSPD